MGRKCLWREHCGGELVSYHSVYASASYSQALAVATWSSFCPTQFSNSIVMSLNYRSAVWKWSFCPFKLGNFKALWKHVVPTVGENKVKRLACLLLAHYWFSTRLFQMPAQESCSYVDKPFPLKPSMWNALWMDLLYFNTLENIPLAIATVFCCTMHALQQVCDLSAFCFAAHCGAAFQAVPCEHICFSIITIFLQKLMIFAR